ncbi:sugar ABC transporter ATP-binding protein [Candidatus Bipolaricaulota bacterium]|nr:sugar ABC transporter ATP-binding protein [Candidatus Bipolaricaulota bacterium]
MTEELVRMEDIVKSFGKVQALKGVDMEVHNKEIVGLVGDNGAGKSTLIKILSGALSPTSGKIWFEEERVSFQGTNDGIKAGIETVYQDAALVGQLSVARNLFLGREPLKKNALLPSLDKQYMDEQAVKLLQQVGLTTIDPSAKVNNLSGGQRQSIAIARGMFFRAKLIILDEPTNNLGVEESRNVLSFVMETKERGHSSIFITHNIRHIYQVADRIVVLRDGKKVGDLTKEETTMEEIEEMITGIEVLNA